MSEQTEVEPTNQPSTPRHTRGGLSEQKVEWGPAPSRPDEEAHDPNADVVVDTAEAQPPSGYVAPSY